MSRDGARTGRPPGKEATAATRGPVGRGVVVSFPGGRRAGWRRIGIAPPLPEGGGYGRAETAGGILRMPSRHAAPAGIPPRNAA